MRKSVLAASMACLLMSGFSASVFAGSTEGATMSSGVHDAMITMMVSAKAKAKATNIEGSIESTAKLATETVKDKSGKVFNIVKEGTSNAVSKTKGMMKKGEQKAVDVSKNTVKSTQKVTKKTMKKVSDYSEIVGGKIVEKTTKILN